MADNRFYHINLHTQTIPRGGLSMPVGSVASGLVVASMDGAIRVEAHRDSVEEAVHCSCARRVLRMRRQHNLAQGQRLRQYRNCLHSRFARLPVHGRSLRLRPHLRRHRMRLALGKQAEVLRDLGAFQQNAGTAPPGAGKPPRKLRRHTRLSGTGFGANAISARSRIPRPRSPPRKLRHPPACARRRGTAASA
jgi:hypothetical protein